MAEVPCEREKLQRLNAIVSTDVGELYLGVGAVCDSLESLCADINDVLKAFIERPHFFDISEDVCVQFLRITLPGLCEVFLRRQTKP
jgi:hypothetical protein